MEEHINKVLEEISINACKKKKRKEKKREKEKNAISFLAARSEMELLIGWLRLLTSVKTDKFIGFYFPTSTHPPSAVCRRKF